MTDASRFRSESLDRDFEQLGEIGRGGMGVVHRALERRTGRVVAVKVIRARYLEDAETVSRFEREAKSAVPLRHPNIVAVHELRRLEDGGIALVMQYVPGGTLKEQIRDVGPLPFARVEQVLRDVGAALRHAHATHIIHRDVKPENIFVEDATGRALLADFGIARSTEQDSSLTLTGVAIGTPAYMSPEQIDGGELDGRSDLYSLGLVGWEMLGARRPWEGESLYGVIYRQKHEDLPPVETFRPDVPPRIAHAIGWALQKEARNRPANVDDLLRQLDSDTRLFTPPPRRRGAAPPSTADPASTMRFDRPLPRQGGATRPPRERTPAFASIPPHAQDEHRSWWRSRAALAAALVAVPVLLVLGAVATGAISGGEESAETAMAVVDEPIGVPIGPTAGPDTAPLAEDAAEEPDDFLPETAPERTTVSAAPADPPGEVPRAQPPMAVTGPQRQPLATRPEAIAQQPRIVPAPVPAPAPAPAPARSDEIAAVAAGGTHSCALSGGGELFCWGGNDRGQLAVDGPRRSSPATSVTDQRFVLVSAGLGHTCAISRSGEAYCWGGNASGQLGNGSSTAASTPARVAGSRAFRTISAGVNHTCAVARSGEAYCWGSNGAGQLGDGTTASRTVPVRLAGGGSFTDITAGRSHSCAVSPQQVVYCWGGNSHGQLGEGRAEPRPYPSPISGATRFSSVVAGHSHSCALSTGGEVFCWGDNAGGQLGDGTTTSRSTPARVAGDVRFAALVAGSMHTCGLTRGGEAYCWGRNNYGQLGDGSGSDRATPVRVRGGHSFRVINASGAHTCGVSTGGEVLCWGYNVEGQLGDGSRSHRATPVAVGRPTG